ncbi:SWIM zinc finger family protein [Halococcus sp. PRR34]|uniref:SWIM zinc finger family protein n=1 Tax=Halococcus sp. PRR34 TaxID=3020830 RepID=UPI00235F1B4C|nr:SWIM zinc finger family protein [Halococcus sp. PRR34]
MSTTSAVPDRSIDLTAARFERAVAQEINVERTAPLIYEADRDGEIYAVDLESGHCTCPDCQFRGLGCKHSINCALDTLFTDGSQSRFVAQVIRFAREVGCPFEARGCDGPCGIGVYPCPDCVTGIGVGDWKVWTHLVRDTGGEDR